MNTQKFRTSVVVSIAILSCLSLLLMPVWSQRARAQDKQEQKPAQKTPAAGTQNPPKPEPVQPSARGVALVSTLPVKPKRFALVIGVDQYDDPQVVGLGGAANDARLLAMSLVHYAGFPSDQVIVLASGEPPDRQPTRGNILRRLSNLAAAVPKDGLLLFSFAGHGMERSSQAFLLPADAQVSDDVNLLEQTAINVVQIKDWIHKTGVSQVLLLLDACRNDPSAGRATADNPLSKTYMRGFDFDVRNREVQAFATLYATQIGQRAYEAKERRHGYFTLAIVEGLQGRAANSKSEVTLAGLVNYLQNTVPQRVLLDLGQGKVQRPFAVVEGYRADELVLSLKDERAINAPQTTGHKKDITTSTSAGPPVETSAVPNPVDEGEEGKTLAQTTWRGLSAESGAYSIEFLKGGKLHYSFIALENGKEVLKTTSGVWDQVGKEVQISIADYALLQGTIEGDVIKGDGSNIEGVKWNFKLLRKK
jgi:hypothetical protein